MNKQRSVCRVSDRAGWWVSQVLSWRSQGYLLGKVFQKFPGVFSWGAATVAVSGGAGKGCSLRALELPRYPWWRLSGCLPRAPWQLCRRSARPSGLGPRAAGTGGVQPHSRAGIAGQPPCQAPLWPHCPVRQALPLSRAGGPRSQCTEGEAKGASAHLWLLRVKHRWGSALVPRRWLCRPRALGHLLVSGCPCWAGGCACSPPSLAVFPRSGSRHT